jgi:hypothetical protein
VPVAKPARTVVANGNEDSGALSSDAAAPKADVLKGTHWPPMRVTSGEATIRCDDDADDGAAVAATAVDATADAATVADADAASQDVPADARALADLDFASVRDVLAPCKASGLVQLRYHGKINSDFTALMQRVAAMSDRLDIHRRLLDIDSTGGRIEDAMPAGDAIAESHWTIRVRDISICHSACVLVLAAGDEREIAGRIGIHRMIRVDSRADTRAELNQELREVYGEMKDYLERNGASVAVADLMMTVPNRSLRLLTETELQEYGLSGTNAVQDDLDRIRLTRKCGADFVKRRDAYARAYDNECVLPGNARADAEACGLALRARFGFPDAQCPTEGPLAWLPDPPASVQGASAAAPAEQARVSP